MRAQPLPDKATTVMRPDEKPTTRADVVRYEGGCHCGTIRITLETERVLGEFTARRCTCSFCTKHGALYVSDPAGQLRVTAPGSEWLGRYRFGFETADFVFCQRCHTYVAAIAQIGGDCYGVINANAMDRVAEFAATAGSVDVSHENTAERTVRRRARWTPTVVDVAGAAPTSALLEPSSDDE